MNNQKKCTVIIPIFNEINSIKNFLNSLYSQTQLPDEIIIIDGGSQDGTYEFLKKEEKKRKLKTFQIISNISEARNFAIKKAKNKIILCTDAGCEIDKNWCKEIINCYKNKNIKMVGGMSKYSAKTEFQKKSKIHVLPKNTEKPFFSSRNISFYKEVWEKVGGYPEYLTRWGEDTLFNYFCKKEGYKIHYCKTAIVKWDLRKNFKEIYNMYRNYTHGDTEVLVCKGITQSLSTKQAILFRIITIFLVGISFRIPLLAIIILAIILGLLSFHKNEKDYIFTLKFNIAKLLGIMIGFIKGIISGIQIRKKIRV